MSDAEKIAALRLALNEAADNYARSYPEHFEYGRNHIPWWKPRERRRYLQSIREQLCASDREKAEEWYDLLQATAPNTEATDAKRPV